MASGQNLSLDDSIHESPSESVTEVPAWDCHLEKNCDETIIKILSSLEHYYKKADTLNLKITAWILQQAREQIIEWTTENGFDEALNRDQHPQS